MVQIVKRLKQVVMVFLAFLKKIGKKVLRYCFFLYICNVGDMTTETGPRSRKPLAEDSSLAIVFI